MTMQIEAQVSISWFGHIIRALGESWDICTRVLPHRRRASVHKNASEVLGCTCEMEDVKRVQVPKYLNYVKKVRRTRLMPKGRKYALPRREYPKAWKEAPLGMAFEDVILMALIVLRECLLL